MNVFTIAWIVSVLGSNSSIVAKLDNEQIENAKIIYYHAQEYDINQDTFLRLAACESGLRQQAIGDKRKAKGILQFHKGTFDGYSRHYGVSLDRNNAADQIFLASNIISKEKNGINHWWRCKKLAFK